MGYDEKPDFSIVMTSDNGKAYTEVGFLSYDEAASFISTLIRNGIHFNMLYIEDFDEQENDTE